MADEFWENSPFGTDSIFHPSWEKKQVQERLVRQDFFQHKNQNDGQLKSVKVVSKTLNSFGKPKTNQSESGLYLFTVLCNENKNEIDSSLFIRKYQSLAPDINFVINGQEQIIRSYAKITDTNKNKDILSNAVQVFTLDEINDFINEAVNFVREKESEGFSNSMKWNYFGHGKKFDWKYHKGKNYLFSSVGDLGVFETNHIGNIIYGRIASNLGQETWRILYDGDWYQNDLPVSGLYWNTLDGIDDPLDSYSLAIGGLFLGKLTVKSLTRILSFDKKVKANWTAWDDFNTTTYNIKYKNNGIKTFKTTFKVD